MGQKAQVIAAGEPTGDLPAGVHRFLDVLDDLPWQVQVSRTLDERRAIDSVVVSVRDGERAAFGTWASRRGRGLAWQGGRTRESGRPRAATRSEVLEFLGRSA